MKTTDLNLRAQHPDAFIHESERDYRNQIRAAADSIYRHRHERPIVLISGPSGAGKTTTAMRLEKYLDRAGAESTTLSMDNYFASLTPEEKELLKQQKFDLETPARLDMELLNSQLRDLMEQKPVVVPKFDFVTNTRVEGAGTLIERKDDEIIILEGIHALNPAVTGKSDDFTTRIYISVRTRIADAADVEMHPMKVRLMRRMLRDKLTRGREIADTLKMLDSVKAGEDKYIMPYKYRANFELDTFLKFELNVYKSLLGDEVKALAATDDRLSDVVRILEELDPMGTEHIPADSLIREFIGGSSFVY